jgi:16S rRNA (guanine966-N2)-methyltransferase
VRITAGKWRSRRLQGPGKSAGLRPTPDSMRERAFAVLGDRVSRSRFLDLFAGTGAVGLEALSRGARSVVFVERHRSAAHLIEKNCASFDLTVDRAELLVRHADVAIRQLISRGDSFDIAWADPPFEIWNEGLNLVARLFEDEILKPGGLACFECPAKAEVANSLPSDLQIVRDLAGSASRVVMIAAADTTSS